MAASRTSLSAHNLVRACAMAMCAVLGTTLAAPAAHAARPIDTAVKKTTAALTAWSVRVPENAGPGVRAFMAGMVKGVRGQVALLELPLSTGAIDACGGDGPCLAVLVDESGARDVLQLEAAGLGTQDVVVVMRAVDRRGVIVAEASEVYKLTPDPRAAGADVARTMLSRLPAVRKTAAKPKAETAIDPAVLGAYGVGGGLLAVGTGFAALSVFAPGAVGLSETGREGLSAPMLTGVAVALLGGALVAGMAVAGQQAAPPTIAPPASTPSAGTP